MISCPTISTNALSNQVVCNNTSTTTVSFSGTPMGTVYNWSNNNTTIGLSASGMGNISSFTASNGGTSPNVATITVSPTYYSCTVSAINFNITVNPSGQVNSISNQTVCNGGGTSLVTFGTNNTGGTTTYTWTRLSVII